MISQENAMVSWRDSPVERESCMLVRRKDIVRMDVVDGLKERRENIQRLREGRVLQLRREFVQANVGAGALEETRVWSLILHIVMHNEATQHVVQLPLRSGIEHEEDQRGYRTQQRGGEGWRRGLL